MHMTPPRAIRSPIVSVASPQGKKTKHKEKDDDNSGDRIEHGSHKENHKIVDDDDDNGEEKGDDLGTLEIRTEETHITIPTPPSSPRKILSSDKKIDQELMDDVSNPTTTTSKHSHFKIQISSRYSHLSVALRRMYDLIEYNLKPCIAKTIIEDCDDFQSEVPALISQEFKTHAPRIIEDLFKEYVQSNVIYVHPSTTTSIEPNSSADLQHQLYLKMKSNLQDRANDIDAWEEENIINEDEVIPEDETLELIAEFQNIDKHVPTFFDHARMETYWITEEKKYILSLYKIHAEEFPEPDLEEKMNQYTSRIKRKSGKFQKTIVTDQQYGLDFMEKILVMRANAPSLTFPGIEEHASYLIVDKPQTSLIYLNRKDEKRVMYLVDIVKFCNAMLEKGLNEVNSIMFESQFLKRSFQASKSLKANEDMRIFCEWKTSSADDEAFVIINP
ncbi:hypothetical protein Tco_0689206 [Tanacetum coccineum]